MNEEISPRATVRFTRSSQTSKEGFEVSYEDPDPEKALTVAMGMRQRCIDALAPKSLTEQLEESIAAIK